MDEPLLFLQMNIFLALEKGAVKLYKSFARAVNDQDMRKYLEKFAEIEASHVQFWEKEILKRGGRPTNKIFDITAGGINLFSKGVALTGVSNMLRLGIYSEEAAVRDYNLFYRHCKNKYPLLAERVWNLASDEALHSSWQKEKLRELLKAKVTKLSD